VGRAALEFREKLFRKSTSADEFHGDIVLKAIEDKSSDAMQSQPVVALPPEQQNLPAPRSVHVPAPPIAAPAQVAYVPPTKITTSRRCAWFPLCESSVSECHGTIKASCVNNDKLRGREEECQQKKDELLREENRKRSAKRREEKKRKIDSISNDNN